MGGGSAAKKETEDSSGKSDAAAPAASDKDKPSGGEQSESAKGNSDGVPEWKKRQLAQEAKERARIEAEAAARAERVAKSPRAQASVETTPIAESFKTDASTKQRETTLVNWMEGKNTDVEAARKAAEAERERLESIFKAKTPVNKKSVGRASLHLISFIQHISIM